MAKVEDCPEFWAQLKRHEGERRDKVGRHVAYICPAGKLTIGWGHNLDDNPIPNDWFSDGEKPREGSVITDSTAKDLLRADVAACARELDMRLYFWREMSAPRQGVLLNMCFNMGIARLKKFKEMLSALQRGSYREAAFEMGDSKWAKQVKSRATELALQMMRGEWVGADGKPLGGGDAA